jgi:putative ABC transport system substrate-binding protein
LNDEGYVEGRTVTIEFRFAGFQPNRLLALAAEHVGRRVAVIAATGDTVTALSAKAATATTDQSRPRTEPQPAGGNLTGISLFGSPFLSFVVACRSPFRPASAVANLYMCSESHC